MGWAKGHVKGGIAVAKWNQQAEQLAQIRVVDGVWEKWEQLAEWLHIKQGNSGKADLY